MFLLPSPFDTYARIVPSYRHILFKQQLFKQRLLSYNLVYNSPNSVCNYNKSSLNESQTDLFNKIPLLLQLYRRHIPRYPKDYFQSRGIVLTVGRQQIKYAKINLKLMELTGTKLPIEIWYTSLQIPHCEIIDLILVAPNLNASACCFRTAECRNSTDVWKLNTTYIYKPRAFGLLKQFPYKPAAIISSTFSEVLFLDCDAYLMRDPEELFLTDPMYLKFGALFFPDAIKSRQHPAVWTAFNTSCIEDEYEFDSAMILVDKRRVWNGLYMTKLMNDNHESFYEHATDGDKDTFRLAFRHMKVNYYLVTIPCSTGSFNGSHFCGYSLCKTDSLAQHIYVNHLHIFKYEGIKYTAENLGYTRIGIGDPNNHSFYFHHCQWSNSSTSCFQILENNNKQIKRNDCPNNKISLEEIEDHQYTLNEPLLNDQSKNNRILMSKTNNFVPHFIDNMIKYSKLLAEKRVKVTTVI